MRQSLAPVGGAPLCARVIALQRAYGNRAVGSVIRSGAGIRRLQRETYRTETVDSDQAPVWSEIVKVVTDWAAYAKAASDHLDAHRAEQADYARLREKLDAHVRLAGIFKDKVQDGRRYADQFVVIWRDNQIGALAIRRLLGSSKMFLDDLWSNPRKAYALTPQDRIAGRDVSGAAALESLIAKTYERGGDLKLIGGDRSAREYYWKLGFGVRVKLPNSRLPQLDYSKQECVDVNPTPGTTERAMELPRERQQAALTQLRAVLAPPPASVQAQLSAVSAPTMPSSSPAPAPAGMAPSVSSPSPAAVRNWTTDWPTRSWEAYLDWVNS